MALIKNAAMNMEAQISFWVSVFPLDKYRETGLLDHRVALLLIFFRNLYSIFHSGFISFHSHQQYTRAPFSPPGQHLSLVFKKTILRDARGYLIMVWICIFLMISDAEHHFMYLLAIYMSSLEKCLFSSSTHFLTGLFILLWELYEILIYFAY